MGAENAENLISAQPPISAHPEGSKIKYAPRALNRINTVIVVTIAITIINSIIMTKCEMCRLW